MVCICAVILEFIIFLNPEVGMIFGMCETDYGVLATQLEPAAVQQQRMGKEEHKREKE